MERLQDIEKKRDELLEVLDNLQALYKEKSEATNVASIEVEADGIVDRANSETSGARLFLAKGAPKTSDVNSNAVNKSGKLESTCAKDGHVDDPNKQLKRIRIPKILGDKMKYSTWWAAFSSCVDETTLSPQFKMLQLESCLEGEAAKMVRGFRLFVGSLRSSKGKIESKVWRKSATGSGTY